MENLWEYLAIAAALYLAFRLGQFSIIALLRDEIRERILRGDTPRSAVHSMVDVAADLDSTTFTVERHGDQYYAYTSQGEFLAQGADFGTVFAAIRLRWPDRDFRVDPRNPDFTEAEAQSLVLAMVRTFGESNDRKN